MVVGKRQHWVTYIRRKSGPKGKFPVLNSESVFATSVFLLPEYLLYSGVVWVDRTRLLWLKFGGASSLTLLLHCQQVGMGANTSIQVYFWHHLPGPLTWKSITWIHQGNWPGKHKGENLQINYLSILVSCCYCNGLTQIWQLNAIPIYSLTVLETGSPRSLSWD